jgi:hypothetical protein
MANPAFVARVRELGRLVGQKLYQAFISVGTWFQANWPAIQGGFRTFVQIMRLAFTVAGKLKSVLLTITTPLRIQFKILLAIWDKVLAAVSTGAGLLSHLPGIGDKFGGVRDAATAARETLKNPLGESGGGGLRNGKLTGKFQDRRARGGPVMPGVAYRVGERGPETFVPGMSGSIVPNGGGGPIHVHLHVGTREVAMAIIPEIQRIGKSGATQTRGRHGGNPLASFG